MLSVPHWISCCFRLIEQFESASQNATRKQQPKPRGPKEKPKRQDSSPEDSEDDEEDEEADEDDTSLRKRTLKRKKKDKTKPSFLVQTSSGRTPKATTRYVAEGAADGHQPKKVAKADETAAAKRARLTGKHSVENRVAVTPQNKVGVTIKKSPQSDLSFESTILGLEEELKGLPAKRLTSKEVKKTRRKKKIVKEEEEEMPPKLEPNYPDLKVPGSLVHTVVFGLGGPYIYFFTDTVLINLQLC